MIPSIIDRLIQLLLKKRSRSGKTEEELRRDREANSKKESISAGIIAAALIFEAIVLWEYSEGRSLVETISLIVSDLTIAMAIYAEIHFGREASNDNGKLERISNEKVSAANVAAAAANERAAELEKKNLELQKKFANRRITKDQHDILVAELCKNPATFDMKAMGDPETSYFAQDILKTLADAGWTVRSHTLPIGEMWEGLNIAFLCNDPHKSILAEAFSKVGIPFKWGNENGEVVKIIVGGKPREF